MTVAIQTFFTQPVFIQRIFTQIKCLRLQHLFPQSSGLLRAVCIIGLIAIFNIGSAYAFSNAEKQKASALGNADQTPSLRSKSAINSESCTACHQQEHKAWLSSDHAKAMAMPTSANILADFNNTSATHYSQSAEFFTENGVYKAKVIDLKNDRSEIFSIKYTFGHYPLQQYLVETHPKGKKGSLHVLPFAWDTRPKEEGGQRWYHNYSHEAIDSNDRLHWRQPLQNWNGMCADCHSDELTRNYNEIAQTFDTQFSGINVGCVSCHGQMPESHAQAGSHSTKEGYAAGSGIYARQLDQGNWTFLDNVNTAVWKQTGAGEGAGGSAKSEFSATPRDNSFMDTCFACHALRAPLVDSFKANTPFLDNFAPQIVTPPNYYADGQIKEEVYVYGSFLQSKMYAAGVNCLDCHDPHTMKLKVEGNGLCLQCHKASEFNVVSHVRHDLNTPAAQCVNCHMPDTIYMGVDNRRDHSFKIPRPDLSDEFDTPNACMDCHSDKSNEWAAAQLKEWFGEPRKLDASKTALMRLRHGQAVPIDLHLGIVKNTNIRVIDRASALEMLAPNAQGYLQALGDTNNAQVAKLNAEISASLQQFLASPEPLIRIAAAKSAGLLAPSQRVTWVSPLLKDDLRAVRIEAASALVSLQIAKQDSEAYRAAFAELLRYNHNSAWRGEGRLNQGNLAMRLGDNDKAEMAFKASTQIDPYFELAYMNLADLYRMQQREDLVATVLQEGLQKAPQSAEIAYAYGLHWVRAGQLNKAIEQFDNAMQRNPANPQLAYTYVLAIDGAGNTALALRKLKGLLPKYADKSQLIALGLHLARKQNDRQSFEWFSNQE